jgi:hypothetical protein
MKDWVKWMEGEMESTEPNKLDVFIMGATPNKQLKNQVTYDYRIPIVTIPQILCKWIDIMKIRSQQPYPLTKSTRNPMNSQVVGMAPPLK